MNKRERISSAISALLIGTGGVLMWLGHELLVKEIGLALAVSGIVYFSIIVLIGFPYRNR